MLTNTKNSKKDFVSNPPKKRKALKKENLKIKKQIWEISKKSVERKRLKPPKKRKALKKENLKIKKQIWEISKKSVERKKIKAPKRKALKKSFKKERF